MIDGKEGLVHCFGPEWKQNLLTDGLGESWRITQCGMKFFPTEALTHAPISAVLDLVKSNDLHPEQVEKIQIRSLARAADILSDPSKYDPHTKETADHSLPYVIAAALVDRQVTPTQFEMKKIMDPTIRAQLKKVEVVADPEIEKVFPALQRVIVNITTTDGRKFSKQLDYPKGDPRNPLSDAEIEEKFRALAEGVLSEKAQDKLIDAIWNLEKCASVAKLMALMKADVKKPKAKAARSGASREPRGTAALGCQQDEVRLLAADAKQPGELRSPAQPRAAVATCAGEFMADLKSDDCIELDGAVQEAGGRGSRTGGAAQ